MKSRKEVPLSVLDLAPVTLGATPRDAFANMLDLARACERFGYHRFWLAEHHNMEGIACAATAVLIGHVAGATQNIRVGSGGVMLPNHSPLVVAEQFGTLGSLYPGRIDLGIGRAPGTDQRTMHALRRQFGNTVDAFPDDVREVQGYFQPRPGRAIRAIPAIGVEMPIWLLGSSLFSASLAAELGLRYAFASHFAPDHLMDALEIYRSNFKPSRELAAPYVMVGANAVAAETDAEARRLFTSLQMQFLLHRRGDTGPLQPPVDNMDIFWSDYEKTGVQHALQYSFVGSPATVRSGLEKFVETTRADEVMVTAHIYDHQARLRSFQLVAEAWQAP